MAFASQNIFTSLPPRETALKIPDSSFFFASKPFANPLHLRGIGRKFPSLVNSEPIKIPQSVARVFESEGPLHADKPRMGNQNWEVFLLISELLCLASSAILSTGLLVKWAILGCKVGFQGLLVDGVVAWHSVMLMFSVAIGAWARRWQWRRISSGSSEAGCSEVNLVDRIEKLEDDMRKSVKIVRVLSRQLEKLGIKFRVTRKALNDPIAETAALAKRNSETTSTLAGKEDILEKELGEIQKALIAMQEQQRKQLELVVAICKSGKLFEKQKNVKADVVRTQPVVSINKRL